MMLTPPTDAPAHNAEDNETIFNEIRKINRLGKTWDYHQAARIADQFLIDPKKVLTWGQSIYDYFESEHNAYNGSALKKVESFLSDRFSFRRNAITKKVMFREIAAKEYEPCKYNDIWRLLQHNLKEFGNRAKVPLSDVQTLLESNFVKEYHPIKDYFHSLPEWDGEDYILKLGEHIECDNQPFWLVQFKKALVRMIACSYGLQENRIVMTLFTQRQAIGKNRFIKFLVPEKLREYFKEDPVEDNKDSEIALTQNFVWHMDELESLSRKALSSLKSFISRSVSKQRTVYARQEETRPRIVNFWASTNKDEFLADVQNTRWLCFRVNKINWDYNNDETGVKLVDIDKVWSQAWELYNDGFNYRLDEEERTAQDQLNQGFETMPIEKQLILKHLTQCSADRGEFMMTGDILEYMVKQTGSRIQLNLFSIQSAMMQLGFTAEKTSINGTAVKGYWLIKAPIANGQPYPIDHQVESQKTPDNGFDLPF